MLQAKEDYVVEGAPSACPALCPFLYIKWKISSDAREQARRRVAGKGTRDSTSIIRGGCKAV